MAHTVIGMFDNATEAQQAVQQLVNSGILRDNIDISSGGSSSDDYNALNRGDSGTTAGSGSLGSTGYNDPAGSGILGGTGYTDGTAGSGILGGSGMTDSTSGRLGDDYVGNTGYAGSTSAGNKDYDDTSRYSDRKGGNDGRGNAITRFFKSLFGNNDDEVNTYSNVAERSGSIVTVHAQTKDEAERAADILDNNGAVDVNDKASQYGYGSSGKLSTGDTFMDSDSKEGTSVNVIEEQMEVGKRQVQTGGVRLRSRIVENPVEESLRLREEHVRVERNKVDRPATDADFANFKETEIELTEQSEVPVVSKQARVVEEISLDKEVNEREETIRDTVRSTEVDIENLENKDTRSGSKTSDDDWIDKKNNF